ncbi:MAG TPA: sugar phosphate isomerase/epimerase [Bacteroides sp.]|nr:sugar phosphate isomerase/epimerase [Bacteroides sp.]
MKKLAFLKRIVILTSIIILVTIVDSCSNRQEIPIGVCTSIDNNELIFNTGYSYIEEHVQKFLVPMSSDDEFAENLKKLESSKLSVEACNSFIPGSLKSVGKEADHDKIALYAETAFRRAKEAGIGIIVFGSGGSRRIPEGFSPDQARNQFISLGKILGPIAGQYGVTIVLEPLNKRECNFINSVSEAGELVKEIDHPNFLLLADIYHMNMDDEGPESIIKYGYLIRHVHIAEEVDRAAPGTHNEDFRPYFEALDKVNYKGRISIECRWESMENQAGIAIEAIRSQL